MKISFSIQRRKFVLVQYATVSTLLILSLLLYIYQDFRGADFFVRGVNVFDVALEDSVPNWFSSLNLMISGILLLSIFADVRSKSETGSRYWLLLGLMFIALSIDEVAGFHERSAGLSIRFYSLLPNADTPSGSVGLFHALFSNWIVNGILLCTVVLMFFLPFLRKLPRRTAATFMVAGVVYVGGALGFEIVESWMRVENIGQPGDLIRNIRALIEEGSEMYGIAIFNCTLFGLLVNGNAALELKINDTDGAER